MPTLGRLMLKVKTTYLRHANATQPPTNDSKCLYGVVGPCCRHDRMKIETVKPKIEHINDKRAQEDEMAYLEHAQLAQPYGNSSNRVHKVHRPRHRHGHIKIGPEIVSQTQNGANAYLAHINMLRLNRRPRKRRRTISKLTIKYRMPGESWCNIEDHR